MSALGIASIDLVIANKVPTQFGAVDAYGHVSLRHPAEPDRVLLWHSRSPRLVGREDILQSDLEDRLVGTDNRPLSSLGPLTEMTAAEIDARRRSVGNDDDHPSMMRGFEYDAIEAGLEHLLKERAELAQERSTAR